MTVSCKSAAEAATSAAKLQTGQAASRKRKHKSWTGDDAQPERKGRKRTAAAAGTPGPGKVKGHSRAAGHPRQDPARSSADAESADDDSIQVTLSTHLQLLH